MSSQQSTRQSPERSGVGVNSQQSAAVCPFCKSSTTEMISLFGMQLMTTQHYCNNCHSAFEAVKWEAEENPNSQFPTSSF